MTFPGTTKDSEADLPRVVGGFRLLHELGRGGMGVVYHAEEISSGRAVALKVLASGTEVSEEAFERFRRESRMAASISDSHCVFVYGAHQVDGSPAIAMELCPGETLEHRISRKQPIPIETAVRWTCEILEGLEAAHRAGVVHRDVKPSNCFIAQDDHVKVGDFGLSRSLDTDLRLTQSGAFLGSPLYASPEQVRGREVDRRSDIYSCGATLYALLGGRAPYHGSNIGEVLARILSESPPPLRSLRREIPPELEKVVARAMDRDPAKRFQDHASFRADLEPFLGHEVVAAGRAMRFVAYVFDRLFDSLFTSLVVFASFTFGTSALASDIEKPGMHASLAATLLLAVIAPIYFALSEGLTGASPGKWIFGQRVVDARTLRRSFWRSVLRSLVFFGPGLLTVTLLHTTEPTPTVYQVWSAVSAVTVVGLLISTMRRRNGFRGLHEILSGTRTIRARPLFARARVARPAPVQETGTAEGWPAEIGPYRIETSLGPTHGGTLLGGVDQNLGRAVWVYARRPDAAAAGEDRRSLARPVRLRWLDAIRRGETVYEVFEAPGGASLSACVAQGASFDWPLSRQVLSDLASELAAIRSDSVGSPGFGIEQVWIDRAWNVRLLDEPIGDGGFERRSPIELLSDTTRLLLGRGSAPGTSIPAELPLSAEPVVRKLLGNDAPFVTVEAARRALEEAGGRAMRVTSPIRALQVGVAVLAPAVAILFMVGAFYLMAGPIQVMAECGDSIKQLTQQDRTPPPPQRMNEEDRKAREILISNAASGPWLGAIQGRLSPEEAGTCERVVASRLRPSADEVAWARDRVAARPFRDGDHDADEESETVQATIGRSGGVAVSSRGRERLEEVRRRILPEFVAWSVGAWGVLGTLLAFAFRGGLSLRLFGLGVRNSRGEVASRLRCAWRSLIAWLPLLILYATAAFLTQDDDTFAAGMAFLIAAAAINAAAIAHAIWSPARGIPDRLAGTHLVPR